MRDFTTRIHIEATRSEIWRVLVDFENWPQWTASVKSSRRLDHSPIAIGSRVLIEQPKLRPTVWTVTSWDPETCFVWQSKSPGVLVTASHEVVPDATGCQVTLNIHFGGILSGLVGLLAGRLTTEYMSMEARGLKTRAEANS